MGTSTRSHQLGKRGFAQGPAAAAPTTGMADPFGGTAAAAAAGLPEPELDLVKGTRAMLQKLGPKALTSVVASDLRASVGKTAFADMLARAGGRTFKLALLKLAPEQFVFGPHTIDLAPPPAAGTSSSEVAGLPKPGSAMREVLDKVVQAIVRFQGDSPGKLVPATRVEESVRNEVKAHYLELAASEAGMNTSTARLASAIAHKVAPAHVEFTGQQIRLLGAPPPSSTVRCALEEVAEKEAGGPFDTGDASTASLRGSDVTSRQDGSTKISIASVLGRPTAYHHPPGLETPGRAEEAHRDPKDFLPRGILSEVGGDVPRLSPSSACLEVGRAVEAALLGSSSNSMLLAQLGPLIKTTVSADRYQLACQAVRSRKMSEVIARIGKEDITVEPQVGTGAVVVWSKPEALSRMVNRLRRENNAASAREEAAAPLPGLSLAPGEFATNASQLGIGSIKWAAGTTESEVLVLDAAYRGLLERPCRADGSRCRDVGDLGNRVIQLIGRPAYLRGTQRLKLGSLIASMGTPHIRVETRPGALEAEDAVIDFPSDSHVQPAPDDSVARPSPDLVFGFSSSVESGELAGSHSHISSSKRRWPDVTETARPVEILRVDAEPGSHSAAAAAAGSGTAVFDTSSGKMEYSSDRPNLWTTSSDAPGWGSQTQSAAALAAAAEDDAWSGRRIANQGQPAAATAHPPAAAAARPPPSFRPEIPTSIPSRSLTTREVDALQLLATPLSDADLIYSKDLAFHYHMTLTDKLDGWVMLSDLLRESPPHATLTEDPLVILLKQGAAVKSTTAGVRVKF